jgi:hypothetical protein
MKRVSSLPEFDKEVEAPTREPLHAYNNSEA